jgi:DNA-directed RNA polymerase subunit E'/Rpb7
MDNIYFNCVLLKKIVIESKYLNENIDEYIKEYLQKKIEGVCIDEGYVKPGSINIIQKSVGMILGSRFTGDVTYNIAYTAEVCNPVIGNVIECKVKFINKLGVLGNNGPITIIVGKQFHINDNEINKINKDDTIKVEVIAKKFSLNDSEIKIVAKLWNENSNSSETKNIKKDIISSDLALDNEFIDDNQDLIMYNSDDENDDYSNNEDEDQDDYEEEDEEEDIKMENPDEENNFLDGLQADDIDIDDDIDEEEDEDIPYDE